MTVWLFWASLLLSVASFGVFAYLAIVSVRPKPTAPSPAEPGPRGVPSPGDIADLAEKLAKAGPSATAASLSVFFLLVAAVAAGLVKLAVDSGG